ncbi:putative polyol transporter 5-like [Capsicum annuum]|nr:putative polyol transporter 5-like [Capsicum annuum]
MLHNITSNRGNESTKLSMLDRQRVRIKWQEEQVNQQEMSYFSRQNDQLMNCFHQSSEAQKFHGLINVNDQSLNELVTQAIKPNHCLENNWGDFGTTGTNGFGYVPIRVGHGEMSYPIEMNYAISRTTSSPPTMVDNVISAVKPKETMLSSNRERESF